MQQQASKLVQIKSIKQKGEVVSAPQALKVFRDSKGREMTSLTLTLEQAQTLLAAAEAAREAALSAGVDKIIISLHSEIKNSVNGPFPSAFMTISPKTDEGAQGGYNNRASGSSFRPKSNYQSNRGGYANNSGTAQRQSVSSIKAKISEE